LRPHYIEAWRALARFAEEEGSDADAQVLRSAAESIYAMVGDAP
jgi:hypothetical protein